MNKNKILLIVLIFVFCIVGALLIINNINNTENNISTIASLENNEEVISKTDKNEEPDQEVVLTISSNCDISALDMKEVMNNSNYYVVLGKITSIDGSSNYNEKKNIYTSICSLGTLEVTKDLKGNMEDTTLKIIKRGGKISLESYEKSLSEAQKQKDEFQTLINNYSNRKSTVMVEEKSLEEIEPVLNQEYLFIMNYNEDYDRYFIDTFPDALREVKRENGKIYLKDNSTNNFNEVSNFDEILNK